VLYFYPKDNTTQGADRGVDFGDRHRDFRRAGADKNMYGRKVRGIERSTFVSDDKGRLAREWRGVKMPGHVEEVLSFVKAL